MRNVSDDSCRANQNIFLIKNFFENHAVYDVMWKNIVQPDRPQVTTWRLRIICWLPKAADTNSEYVIFIAFPLQQLLHERATMLCHMYAACLVKHWYSVKSQKTVAFRTTDNVTILKYNLELVEIRPVL